MQNQTLLPFNKPSRYKVPKKHKGLLTDKDCFNYLQAKFDLFSLENKCSKINLKKYLEIIDEFNTEIMDLIASSTFIFNLGSNLGNISIKNRKIDFSKTTLKVNYEESKKVGYIIYHLNEHTNYKYYKYYWTKGVLKDIHSFTFIPTRDNQRNLAKKLKQ